ncbi:MAG: PQQ-dependent sugar dehydrogenase [Candidatus Goldiibacteriota bacterium]
MKKFLLCTAVVLLSAAGALKADVSLIELPEGFGIHVFADGVDNARAMAVSGSGVVFVGSRSAGKVYAVVDKDRDMKADEVITIASGLNSPAGVDLFKGDLYVSEISGIIRFPQIEKTMRSGPEYETIPASFPDDKLHGWKFIKFGPDEMLYVPVGAPCNVCLKDDPIYASITRMKPDGSAHEIYARGIRNTVGFDWHPRTEVLWFTDNGRDRMGDNRPPDELNKAPKQGMHFGFPYMHGSDIRDPEYYEYYKDGKKLIGPEAELGPHVAALGMRFYDGVMFPDEYRNTIFIAEHGSWNRSSKIGYRITAVDIIGGQARNYRVFASGWKQGEKAWGRPADVEIANDGSLLVSDDKAGKIYRIYYGESP